MMRRTMMCALAMVLLVATACETRAEVSVNDDGSGTFGFAFGIEPFLMRGFPEGADSPLGLFKDELKGSGVPWVFSDFKEPGLQGIRATLPFDNVEHLKRMLNDIPKDSGTLFGNGDNIDDDSLAIQQLEGGWVFRSKGMTPGARDAERAKQLGVENIGAMPKTAEIDKAFRFEFHVTLPGEPRTSNATEVTEKDGRTTFVWRTGTFDENALELRAQTDPAKPGFPVVPAAAGVLLLGAAGWMLRGHRPRIGGTPPVVLEGLPVLDDRAPEPVGVSAAPAEVYEEPVHDLMSDLP